MLGFAAVVVICVGVGVISVGIFGLVSLFHTALFFGVSGLPAWFVRARALVAIGGVLATKLSMLPQVI